MANNVNFGDASSIIKSAQQAALGNKPTGEESPGTLVNAQLASQVQDDYQKVSNNPHDKNAVNTYASDLATLAKNEGASPSDVSALNAAATAALHGAGVSDDDIAAALSPADAQLQLSGAGVNSSTASSVASSTATGNVGTGD